MNACFMKLKEEILKKVTSPEIDFYHRARYNRAEARLKKTSSGEEQQLSGEKPSIDDDHRKRTGLYWRDAQRPLW